VFVPSGHKLTYLQPYVLRFVKGQSMATWVGDTVFAASIATDLWATYTVTVPADSDRAAEVGIEFRSDPGWKGTVWVDAVTW
jgi:hypothetical protein